MDSLVYLALAVILFRGFAAEGYMISTGSMAPCLLGYHRQVVCPSCSFTFSRGMHFDDDQTILAAGNRMSDLAGNLAAPAIVCPNCGLQAIDASHVPRNEGDQLLVHKHLYQLRSPRRWEVVVFRHPTDSAQAYVKRVVGLPGETIDILDGDVYADGALQRKSLETQRSMRIAVYDHDHTPTDAQWQPRWRMDDDGRWTAYGDGFVYRREGDSPHTGPPHDLDWLTYHHWVRAGGLHHTSIPLAAWPAGVPPATLLDQKLFYDVADRRLEYQGVLPQHLAHRLQVQSSAEGWAAAIDALEQRSHESPVVDLYGYNHPDAGDGLSGVHDLMIEAVVGRLQGDGLWRMQMTDGWHRFSLEFDMAEREVRLYVDESEVPIRSGRMPQSAFANETTVEMSLFDRQAMVAIDGVLPFASLPYSSQSPPRQLSSTPVRIGVADLDLYLSHLRLYRDVYYTPKHAPGREDTAKLGPDEFFMLGDNSPVSIDSRAWDSPAIPRALLIGKPFLVHLPSRQEQVSFAGSVHHIRIPDFSRVRYIH